MLKKFPSSICTGSIGKKMTSQEKKEISSPNTIFSCGVSGFSCHWMQSNHPSCTLIKAGQIWLKKWDRRGISSKRSSVIQTCFLKDLLSPCLAPVPGEMIVYTLACSVSTALLCAEHGVPPLTCNQNAPNWPKDEKRCQIRK